MQCPVIFEEKLAIVYRFLDFLICVESGYNKVWIFAIEDFLRLELISYWPCGNDFKFSEGFLISNAGRSENMILAIDLRWKPTYEFEAVKFSWPEKREKIVLKNTNIMQKVSG